MKKEILVNVTAYETRVAIVENSTLQELQVQQAATASQTGNIYKAKVARVLPGMEAAFVDYGRAKNGFLHRRDIAAGKTPAAAQRSSDSSIRDLVHDGQHLLVQVIKDEINDKGARLSTEISLATANLAYLPDVCHHSISRKIEQPQERRRLLRLIESEAPNTELPGGFIVRTAASDATDDVIRQDMLYLQNTWSQIRTGSENATVGDLLYQDLPLSLAILRDISSTDVGKIYYDQQQAFDSAVQFAARHTPRLVNKIVLHDLPSPLLTRYAIEQQIATALRPQVPLDCGGYLVIEQTEALTVVDVNSGAYTGNNKPQQTSLQVNLQAATEIARQLRLRNTGGLVIIDFIDMQASDDKNKVLRTLQKATANDRVTVEVSEISPHGLVELTRRRVTSGLQHQLCEPCPVCEGAGYIKTARTVCYEIYRELQRQSEGFVPQRYTIVTAPGVADLLRNDEADRLKCVQESLQRPVDVKVDTALQPFEYEIALS